MMTEKAGGMKFKKKPVVVEAMQFDGQNHYKIFDWSGELTDDPPVMDCDDTKLTIETLEGTMTASPGDWIIQGINGEFYPCKPDIFEATYETVDE